MSHVNSTAATTRITGSANLVYPGRSCVPWGRVPVRASSPPPVRAADAIAVEVVLAMDEASLVELTVLCAR
ncbi:hypothetical protein GCM10010211_40390 [Streptomyces albospinus]|uniref:Uncharacterized protein n=1 Tax=Streptomyces albospinus TaxID=285515 RepID=A0ABQ2V7E2_9ACTN|nr:hypothetical protein GCM10010211_40390 [Streptomyces albospinus]